MQAGGSCPGTFSSEPSVWSAAREQVQEKLPSGRQGSHRMESVCALPIAASGSHLSDPRWRSMQPTPEVHTRGANWPSWQAQRAWGVVQDGPEGPGCEDCNDSNVKSKQVEGMLTGSVGAGGRSHLECQPDTCWDLVCTGYWTLSTHGPVAWGSGEAGQAQGH